jgi:hypothetical protein
LSYDFPDDFFDPPAERTEEWPDHPDVRAAVEWFRGFMTAAEWKARRIAAATRLYDMALGRVPPGDKGRLFDEADTFGWYLFLAEAFIDHIGNYEPTFGSRVVPVFAAIGRNLELLKTIDGIDARVRRMVDQDRSQPNGALFELLVAACYARQGGAVTFVPEERGKAKSHDLDVVINGINYAVECKRMETGEYGERERMRMRELWQPCSARLAHLERSTLADVEFRVPLAEVPDDYLVGKVRIWLQSSEPVLEWDDAHGRGRLADLDLRPLQRELENSWILQGSSRLMEVITGEYIRNRSFLQSLRIQHGDNPRYIDECDLAIVLRWQSISDQAISGKARDVLRKLAEANRQLPEGRRGIVHIGFEAVEGDAVERARYDKIIASTAAFDPESKRLEYVYCHYFVPESPPDQSWAFDETTQRRGIRPEGPPPLPEQFLIMPDNAEERQGPHWRSSSA